MRRLRLSDHAIKRARSRFDWSAGKTKSYFRQRFNLEGIQQGRQVLQDGLVTWVVSGENNTVTIITLHPTRFCYVPDLPTHGHRKSHRPG